MSSTYWQTYLDGLSAQEFRLFLHCGLLTGIHIHTLRWKEKDHRILPHITSWVNCSTFLIVFSLFSVDRYPPPHTEMQRRRLSHIVDIAWWVQCATGTDVSGLSCVHRYMRPHSHRKTKTPSHTDTCRLMQLMLKNSMCLFFSLC